MSARRHPAPWTSIRRARRLVERWRSARRNRGSDAVAWARAVKLVGEDALSVDFASDLRVPTSSPARVSVSPRGWGDEQSATFVELVPTLLAGPAQCTLELCDPSGRKLTLSLRSAPGPDLVALTHALWSGLR